MDSNFFMEMFNLKQGFLPVDLNTGANTGFRCPMTKCKRLVFILQMADSTSAAVTLNFLQHDAASSGTSKALSIQNRYYYKKGASTSFTKVEPAAAADTYDLATPFAGDEGIAVFEVLAEDLDVANDFDYVSMSLIDSTAAKVGACLVVFVGNDFNPPYGQVLPAV